MEKSPRELTNVPSYLDSEGLTAECPDLGELTVDVSYGGNFYAIVDIQDNFKGIEHYLQIISCAGQGVKKKHQPEISVCAPDNPP
jgi:4-hydroxyproline epimerase